jgi:hypothetical protein
LLNPTLGIIGQNGAARVTCRRVFGQALTQGFDFEACYDTIRLLSTHLWPHWSFDPRVLRYQLSNGIAYKSARNDNAMWSDNFAIFYNLFLNLSKYAGDGGGRPGGSSFKFQMNNPQSDGCNSFVVSDPDTDGITAAIIGGYHQCHLTEVTGAGTPARPGSVYIEGNRNRLVFVGTEFQASSGSHVCVAGGASAVNIVDLVRPLLGDFDLSNQGVAGLRGPTGLISYLLARKTANYASAGKTMLGANVSQAGDF